MNDLINLFLNHTGDILSVVVIAVLAWDKFRSGSSNLRKEIAADYKERNDQLENKIREFQADLHNTNLLVAELKGTVAEKDKHIASLTQILQGRNPEMMGLLSEIKELNRQIIGFMQQTNQITKETLDYQTELLETGATRNKKIDEASHSHTGEIMRTPVNPIKKTT